MVYSSNPTWFDHYPPTPPPQSFPIRFNFQMGVLPRNDFVANASVSPDYTPFDATFQDRTTFIHHGAYHVAWMLLWECDIVQFSGLFWLLRNDFWHAQKEALTNIIVVFVWDISVKCNEYIYIYIYICPCVYISLNKYPSCKGSLFGAEIVALGFFFGKILTWDPGFGRFGYLTMKVVCHPPKKLSSWLQLVPRPQHNYESNNGQPCRTQGKLVASHDDLINKRPQDGCLSGKLTVVWRFVSLTTRNTWVSFFINLCLPQTPATCGFLRPHQVVLEPLFSSPPIVGLLWDRSQKVLTHHLQFTTTGLPTGLQNGGLPDLHFPIRRWCSCWPEYSWA